MVLPFPTLWENARVGPGQRNDARSHRTAAYFAAGLLAVETTSGRYRWVVCGLLFFATTINYVDRQVLGVLAPYLQSIIGWNEIQYGYIVTAFQAKDN